MNSARRIILFVALAGALLANGCQESGSDQRLQWQPLFGDFTKDTSEVVARVGDIEITQRMVTLFIDELPKNVKAKFAGPDGERLALKKMIDQALMVQGAVAIKLYNDQDVARELISQRRLTLDSAMRNYGVLRDNKPAEADLRAFFNDNKQNYRQQGLVLARHIACKTKAAADKAYQRVLSGKSKDDFLHVVADMSVNPDSRKDSGNVGWFSRGGFIPFVRNSKIFAEKAYDMDIGLHAPIQVGDRWHVVEILKREYERPQTFKEAKDKISVDMLPAWQDALIKDYLKEARVTYSVQMLGKYQPGGGATAEELYARALAVTDVEMKLELLSMIYNDYPTSDKADDALFMSGMLAQERLQDMRVADRYLQILLDEYPDSELIEDATFLKTNLYNPKVLNPQSIEDLRQAR